MLDDSLLVNLDGMFESELMDYALKVINANVSKEDESTAEDLNLYARTKAEAMTCRVKGPVVKALRLESECDRIYDRLPDYAKW